MAGSSGPESFGLLRLFFGVAFGEIFLVFLVRIGTWTMHKKSLHGTCRRHSVVDGGTFGPAVETSGLRLRRYVSESVEPSYGEDLAEPSRDEEAADEHGPRGSRWRPRSVWTESKAGEAWDETSVVPQQHDVLCIA